MLHTAKGDLLACDVDALVNTVNCVGIMGRGVALQFKDAFPDNFKAYLVACNNGQVNPGRMFVYETGHLTNPKYIINFPTKRHWRGNSKIEDIDSGLVDLVSVIERLNITSLAMPPLGSGLGGLPWPSVKKRITETLGQLDNVEVFVFEPREDGDRMKRHRNTEAKPLTPLRAALIGLIDRYLRGLMEPHVTLLELHKLAYFLQTSGLPMRLKFTKAHYGPYAENLRHVLNEMEGHYTAGYGYGGDQPDKRIEIVPGALETAQDLIAHDDTSRVSCARIQTLVKGFETPLGLELLATTHWAVTQEGARSQKEVESVFGSWNERKSSFTSRQIAIALDRLVSEDWLPEIS